MSDYTTYPCPFNIGVICLRKPGADRCHRCGFNPYERAYRAGLIAGKRMVKGPDGLKRLLIIPKEA